MSVEGYVDCIDTRHIRGWAFDPARAHESLEIAIYCGSRRLGTIPADMPRPDLKAIGYEYHHLGFCFRFPEPISRRDAEEIWAAPVGGPRLSGSLADLQRYYADLYFPQRARFAYVLAADFQPDELGDSMRLRGDLVLPSDAVLPRIQLGEGPEVRLERDLPTVGRAKDFWFVENPDRLGFAADIPIDRQAPWNDLWLCYDEQGTTRRRPVVRIPGIPVACPTPPPSENLVRVGGRGSAWNSFIVAGATNVLALEHLLAAHLNAKVPERGVILDWGCGCGRTTWALAAAYPKAEIVGVDIDDDNLAWARKVAPGGRFILSPLFPKLPLADGSVDLIYGISVFTHLTETAQNFWLEELSRILSPGGIAVLTLQLEVTFLSGFFDFAAIETLRSVGIQDHLCDPALNGFTGDDHYYRSTFHTSDYVRDHWARYFDIVAVDPGISGGHQDAVICIKRSSPHRSTG